MNIMACLYLSPSFSSSLDLSFPHFPLSQPSLSPSSTDHFLRSGLPLLHRLIDGGYFLPALRVIANITPRFFKHKKILLETQGYIHVALEPLSLYI